MAVGGIDTTGAARSIGAACVNRQLARTLHVCYGTVTALDGVDFDLYAGEIHCLVGEHRAGKSTLVKVLSGAARVADGSRSSRDAGGAFHAAELAMSRGSGSSTRTFRSSPT